MTAKVRYGILAYPDELLMVQTPSPRHVHRPKGSRENRFISELWAIVFWGPENRVKNHEM